MAEKLIPVIAQDVRTNDVLMLAYMDKKALAMTKKTGYMHYWSRSRGQLWKKGETSGHFQKIVSLHYDCDRDTILARVKQTGHACHIGNYSCFSKKPFGDGEIFKELFDVFAKRRARPKKGSYTNKLLQDKDELLKKVLEEAGETVLAAKKGKKGEIIYESADLMYHLLLLLFSKGLTLKDIEKELAHRRK